MSTPIIIGDLPCLPCANSSMITATRSFMRNDDIKSAITKYGRDMPFIFVIGNYDIQVEYFIHLATGLTTDFDTYMNVSIKNYLKWISSFGLTNVKITTTVMPIIDGYDNWISSLVRFGRIYYPDRELLHHYFMDQNRHIWSELKMRTAMVHLWNANLKKLAKSYDIEIVDI